MMDTYNLGAHPDPISAVAISGLSGCGNTTVNVLVAEALDLVAVNYTMRNYAQEQGVSLEEIARRAQQDSSIDCLIDRRQVELSLEQPSVLSSRLAIWLLPKATLKVYLYASSEVRSQRILEREGKTYEEQLAKTAKRDQRDAARYKKLYGLDVHNFLFADLVINTESFDQNQVANMIVQAYLMKEVGR